MHVFLTGGTGFVGTYILQELLARGHSVRMLVRRSEDRMPGQGKIETVKGDVTNRKSLNGLMRGCDAVVHLVGIIQEKPAQGVTFQALHADATRHVVDQAREDGIERFVHMSANGARPDGVSGYQTSKWEAEEYVRQAGFDRWTIFRPSVVFGDPGEDNPEFASQLARTLVGPFPILPVFGDGNYEMQPISVQEVASAFVQALTNDAARQKTYCVAGNDRIPYRKVLDLIAGGMGIAPKPQIKQPVWLVRPVVQTVGKLGLLPITPDQFEMLLEGNTCDASDFYRDFDLTPIRFTAENLGYLG
ncbi:MAG: NAD(P)H-binding protein [Rhodothermales bacterium]